MTRYRGTGERERRVVLALFVAGLLVGGCDVDHVVGATGGQGGVIFYDADAGYPGAVTSLTATQSWTGTLVNYQFASGSGAVKLSFATDPSGVVVGTFTFGAGGPPPPATDPNGIYPPGPTQIMPNTIVEGFPYRIAQGALVGGQLRLAIWEGEVWAGWCALQLTMPGNPSCLPFGTGCPIGGGQCTYPDPKTGASTPITDAKVQLCNREVCVCNDGSCVWRTDGLVQFDLAMSPTTVSGHASPLNGDSRALVLTKDP